MIVNLGSDYADESSGDILVADLKAPRQRGEDRRNPADEVLERARGDRAPGQRRQSSAN